MLQNHEGMSFNKIISTKHRKSTDILSVQVQASSKALLSDPLAVLDQMRTALS